MREDLNSLIRRTRIVSGLVLFVYASTHLLNHSVAAISIAAADAARSISLLSGATQSRKSCCSRHLRFILLGFQAVLRRKSFKMTAREWVQMVFPLWRFWC